MTIHVKRVYEVPRRADGKRILVDRLWPRGLSKEKAKVHVWIKEIAPSAGLRRWYAHDHQKWPEFKSRYFSELEANQDLLEVLLKDVSEGTVTLLYSSKEDRLNNAFALKEYLESIT